MRLASIVFIFLGLCALGWANSTGFEDPDLLAKVLDGEIVVEDALSTNLEFRSFFRSFFDTVSADSYISFATNHSRWPELLPEIKEGKTTNVSEDRTVFDYWLHVHGTFALFSFDYYPEGRQTVAQATDSTGESRIYNVITNYQDELTLGEMVTRLIPYQSGILVEDNVHVVLAKENAFADLAKNEATKKFIKLTSNLRDVLQGR